MIQKRTCILGHSCWSPEGMADLRSYIILQDAGTGFVPGSTGKEGIP